MLQRIRCWFFCHEWTCRAAQGIKPDRAKLEADPIGYFWEYAQMYCARCGHVYQRSVHLMRTRGELQR